METYPKITFHGDSLRRKYDDEYQLAGDITIKEVTLPIALSVEYAGTVTDPRGNVKAGFEVRGTLNRKNFGLNWNVTTETGGLVVSEDVKLAINLQLVKQAEQVAA